MINDVINRLKTLLLSVIEINTEGGKFIFDNKLKFFRIEEAPVFIPWEIYNHGNIPLNK